MPIGIGMNEESGHFPLAKANDLRHSAALICSPGKALLANPTPQRMPG